MPTHMPPNEVQDLMINNQASPPQHETPHVRPQRYGDRLAWRPYFPTQAIQGTQRTSSNWLSHLVAFLLFVSAVVIGVVYREELIMCLELMADIGSANPQAQLKGFLVLGFLVVALVSVVRILASNQKNNDTSCSCGRDKNNLS